MDMKSVGGWVENIYQKLETICRDVDNTISQKVGQSVKKFCSDAMQDLLLTQMNSEKEDVPATSSGDNGNSEGHLDSRGEEKDEVNGAADWLRQETLNSVQSSSPVEKQESNINKTDTLCTFETETTAASVSQTDAPTYRYDSSPATIPNIVSSKVIEHSHARGSVFHELPVPDHECGLIITSYTNPREYASPKYKSDEMCCNPNPLPEGFSVHDIKLIHPRRSLRSYKKLFQDTIKSKKRIVKEYKQFGIWYGDIYGEPEYGKSTRSPILRQALTSDSQDMTVEEQDLSEWELL